MNTEKRTTPTEARAIAIALSGFGHNVPSPVTSEWLEAAAARGMIRKADLVEGAAYIGACRNASVALWSGGWFHYIRIKFGSAHAETIRHPEADNGYDVFVPTLRLFNPDGT
jgi:hypothetical protein